MFKASEQLVLPKGYITPEWREAQYAMQLRASQELSAGIGTAEVEAQINELHAAPGGLQFIGGEMRSPLLREALYESVHRNLIQVYKLSQGETAEFYADIDVAAAAIGVSGLPGQLEVTSDMARVDTRTFASMPYVRWNVSNRTKFDILAATQQRMKASLMLQESAAWLRLLQYASGLRSGQGTTFGLEGTTAASNNAPLSVATSTAGRISVDQLAIATSNFGARSITGALKLYINPSRMADIKLFNFGGVGTGGNGYFAPEFQDMILRKGMQGSFMGTEIYQDLVVPRTVSLPIDSLLGGAAENVIGYILGPAEFVGVEAIRTDLTIETQKMVAQLADQFAGWSDSGFFVRFVKAIQRLTDV